MKKELEELKRAQQQKGGVEFGFMSCCLNKEDMKQMDSSTVLVELCLGPGDKAADLSQFRRLIGGLL